MHNICGGGYLPKRFRIRCFLGAGLVEVGASISAAMEIVKPGIVFGLKLIRISLIWIIY
jgi:hypothetical protein